MSCTISHFTYQNQDCTKSSMIVDETPYKKWITDTTPFNILNTDVISFQYCPTLTFAITSKCYIDKFACATPSGATGVTITPNTCPAGLNKVTFLCDIDNLPPYYYKSLPFTIDIMDRCDVAKFNNKKLSYQYSLNQGAGTVQENALLSNIIEITNDRHNGT